VIRSILKERAQRRAEQDEVQALYEKFVIDQAQATLDRWHEEKLEARRRWYTKARAPREEYVRGVLAAMSLAAADIGVDVPALVWFEDESPRERAHRERWGPSDTAAFDVIPDCERHSTLAGICWPEQAPRSIGIDAPTIGLRAGQPLLKMLTIAAHEIAHLGVDPSELAARRYEREWLHRIPQTHPEWIARRDAVLAAEIAALEQEESKV
jgi:hypothetical protein